MWLEASFLIWGPVTAALATLTIWTNRRVAAQVRALRRRVAELEAQLDSTRTQRKIAA